jgi:predicted ATPase
VQATFAEGASFLTLAPVSDPALVLATIARTLGVAETTGQPLLQTLKVVLQTRRLLLVLDNFEHLLEAAPLVVELLEACPGVKTLVTGRAALHVRCRWSRRLHMPWTQRPWLRSPVIPPTPSHSTQEPEQK